MRWLHAPLLHFLAGGAVLFQVVHGRDIRPTRAPVVVTAADVERLRADYARETGLAPTADDEARLVEQAIDEELLVREARVRALDRNDRSIGGWLATQMATLTDGGDRPRDALEADARALGLDHTDVVVRRILVQKMRLLAGRSDEPPPDDATLRAFYDTHRDDYRQPDRIGFWHVFLAGGRGDAQALRVRLGREGVAPEAAVSFGDAFPMPPRVPAQAPAQLARVFGAAFASRLAALPPHTWSGPIASPYGVHLVWVVAHEPGDVPSFDAVRSRVAERWKDERRRQRVVELLDELKRRHPLAVESAAWRERSAS